MAPSRSGQSRAEADDSILSGGSPDFHGKHILLAEDNELNREIAVELLSKYGFIFVSQISLTTNP